jgi:hypothetical protein
VQRVQQHVDADEAVEELSLLICHTTTIKPPGSLQLDCYRSSI